MGKAQEVCSALPIEQSLNYDVVKQAVLRAYELVPEAYRQRFRAHKKADKQTFVEFAREKQNLFEKWCTASKATTFEALKELVLLEDFKSSVTETLIVHLNEPKVKSLSAAAVLADEFILTHRTVFSPLKYDRIAVQSAEGQIKGWTGVAKPGRGGAFDVRRGAQPRVGEGRVCFYCLDAGHLVADCEAWKKKNASVKPKGVGFIQTGEKSVSVNQDTSGYKPFMLQGWVNCSPKPVALFLGLGI